MMDDFIAQGFWVSLAIVLFCLVGGVFLKFIRSGERP